MALTSTLFTGLSGLNVNQTRLNVVGNNIANVNTIAYKSSRALFKPQFYVTDGPGSPPGAEFGGQNPSQRGLGATVAAIQKDFSTGSLETTGKSTDLAIDGSGFFIVQGQEQRYTRDGSFILNQNNELVTTGGDFVQGFDVDADGNVIPGALQNIQIPLGALTKAEATESVLFSGNLNAAGERGTIGNVLLSQPLSDIDGGAVPAGQAPVGGTLLTDLRAVDSLGVPTAAAIFADGDTISLAPKRGGRTLPPLSMDVTATTTVNQLNAFFAQVTGIETSIPTASATIGTSVTAAAQAGDPANTRRLRIEGNAGDQNALSFAGTQLGSRLGIEQSSAGTGESAYTSFTVYDSLGTALTVNMTTVLETADANGTTWRFFAYSGDDTNAATFDPLVTSDGIKVATGTVSFDTNGRLLTDSPLPIQIDREDTGAGDPLAFSLDFGQMNSLADTPGNTSKMFAKADGKPIGTLNDFSISADGTITGSYDNGTIETLGQVAVATFDNVEGLLDDGGNMYSTSANSGAPKITGPLELSAGALRAGTLELSNVDLSEEFVNLIISSTGFTAASRVISTSDQLLTELLNTSR